MPREKYEGNYTGELETKETSGDEICEDSCEVGLNRKEAKTLLPLVFYVNNKDR